MKSILRAMDGPTLVCLVLVAMASAATLNAQETESQPAEAPATTAHNETAHTDEGEETAASALPDAEGKAEDEICLPREPRTVTLPKLTQIYISIDAAQGSKTSTSGDTFPITVTEPVIVDSVEVIPVGTKGEGEVIHAKKAGGSGAGGELILTANYIELGERRIPLRSMKLGLSGKAQTGLAIATGPVGFLVRGKNVHVAAGTLAGAKLAEDTEILLGVGESAASDKCTDGANSERDVE